MGVGTMLDSATRSLGTIRVMSNVALMAGSSQQGKARRASVACEWGGGGGGGGRWLHQRQSNELHALHSQHKDFSFQVRGQDDPLHTMRHTD